MCAGSHFSVFGERLAPRTRSLVAEDLRYAPELFLHVLPTILDGVSVSVNGKPAYLTYVSPTQINAIAPDDPTIGTVVLQLSNQIGSAVVIVQKTRTCPGLVMFEGADRKYVAATNQDGTLAVVPESLPYVGTMVCSSCRCMQVRQSVRCRF
ncbi:MAG: hypothetical protein ACRD7E_03365 [Bryobacteraceae bacterium]